MGERHRPIRARSAPGQVAGAATEKHGLEAHRSKRRARLRSPQQNPPVPGAPLIRGGPEEPCRRDFHAPKKPRSASPRERPSAFSSREAHTTPSFAEQQRDGAEYNFKHVDAHAPQREGMSVFALKDGVVHHTYSTYDRGVEQFMGTFRYLDVAPLGRNEEGNVAGWWHRHDEYAAA